MHNEIFERIRQDISGNDIVLYMKGTAVFPQDGYSAVVVLILDDLGLRYKDIDVLSEPALHQAVKDFTNWPNVPQLYIRGEFIGGCDIVKEMHATGELQRLLEEKGLIPR